MREENVVPELVFEELNESDARLLKVVLEKCIKSYTQKDKNTSDNEWLKALLKNEMSELSDEQCEKQANEITESISEYEKNLESINLASTNGTSKEEWFAKKVEDASIGVSVVEHCEYLASIDNTLANANAQMMRTVTTNSGAISQNVNLDGFIAEQHHVNTFNSNAVLQKSKYYAEVKVPEAGETYAKNSVDIVIRDATNHKAPPVYRYQVKYGSDAKATIQMLRDHGTVTKYSNQRIVVPADQVAEVQKAFPGKTVVSQIGGTDAIPISSNPLTKAEAKQQQLSLQKENKVSKIDWNTFNAKRLAVQIGKSAALSGASAAAVTTGFSIAYSIIKGEGVDTYETVAVALKTGADTGLKSAVAGAIKIASEKGIVRLIPKGTPAGIIGCIACLTIENTKIFAKVATGEITMLQAIDRMGRTSISMVYSLGWSTIGAGIGAAALSWIPFVGPAIGGLVGGMVGYMAGTKFGGLVFDGLKKVGKGIVNTCKSAWNALKSLKNRFKSKVEY